MKVLNRGDYIIEIIIMGKPFQNKFSLFIIFIIKKNN